MLGNAVSCQEMLGQVGTRQEFPIHRQKQQPAAVPKSLEFSSPKPPQSFSHQTGVEGQGWIVSLE